MYNFESVIERKLHIAHVCVAAEKYISVIEMRVKRWDKSFLERNLLKKNDTMLRSMCIRAYRENVFRQKNNIEISSSCFV